MLPVKTQQKYWQKDFPDIDFENVDYSFKYISFGWGDKEFYLNTPTWADLKWDMALKALFIPTPSLIHVIYLRNKPELSDLSKKVLITDNQYKILINYIDNSFSKDDNKRYILIKVPYKSTFENYYESNGSYNFINTCNNWTNRGLKLMGVKTAIWAPFDKCVLYHF